MNLATGRSNNKPNPDVGDAYAGAMLFASRDPLMRLGLDPKKTSFSYGMYTTGGLFDPRTGNNWSSVYEPEDKGRPVSSFAHEAMHSGFAKAIWPQKENAEELMVRHTMDTIGQGFEFGKGSLGDRQINRARALFSDPTIGPQLTERLNRYRAMAENELDARRKEDWSYRGVMPGNIGKN